MIAFLNIADFPQTLLSLPRKNTQVYLPAVLAAAPRLLFERRNSEPSPYGRGSAGVSCRKKFAKLGGSSARERKAYEEGAF
jgi:hypothetical protein